MTQTTGLKYDTDKPDFSLISPIALALLAQVLDFGARKYAAHNWRGGISKSKLLAASHRHIAAISGGTDYDHETGLPHAAHLMCEAMFLCEQLVSSRESQNNDLWQYEPEQKNLLVALLAGDAKEVSKCLTAIHVTQVAKYTQSL